MDNLVTINETLTYYLAKYFSQYFNILAKTPYKFWKVETILFQDLTFLSFKHVLWARRRRKISNVETFLFHDLTFPLLKLNHLVKLSLSDFLKFLVEIFYNPL